jgi:8-oxo-dGTP diphosphatase
MTEKKFTEVAVGILIRSDGALLFTSRPEGKPYAGYWEFPGGKLEAGESIPQALARELEEELGIRITQAHPWRKTEHHYEHASVRLHWCKVLQWQGDLQMREGQNASWQRLPAQLKPILPGAWPVLDWLQAESDMGQLLNIEQATP